VVLGLGAYAEFMPEEEFIVLLPMVSTLVQLGIMVLGRGDETIHLGGEKQCCDGCDYCDHDEKNMNVEGSPNSQPGADDTSLGMGNQADRHFLILHPRTSVSAHQQLSYAIAAVDSGSRY